MRRKTGCMPRRASWPGASPTNASTSRIEPHRQAASTSHIDKPLGIERLEEGWRVAKRALKVHIVPMSEPDTGIPVREPAATSIDDTVLPFAVEALEVRGRVVRLGPLVDAILRGHAYPTPVARLLGEAIVLTVMLGSVLKFEGRFILQTQTDGPVRMLVVDFRTPGSVRGCARFDKQRVAAAMAAGQDDPGSLLGHGHLAMTIDQGPDEP